MKNLYIFFIIIFIPLINFFIISLFGTKFAYNILKYNFVNLISIINIIITFISSLIIFIKTLNGYIYEKNFYIWLKILNLKINFGILIDNLSSLMTIIVVFISLIVYIYSMNYMKKDKSYNRYVSYISLFIFSMINLIISNNLLQLFFFWELIGFISYLLIGFWFKKKPNIKANIKVFIINRIGDIFFILALSLLFINIKSFYYIDIFINSYKLSNLNFINLNIKISDIICIFLFISAIIKSAQFPLHIWLPKSMYGPTPISALMHAATMVTIGIYMICRIYFLFETSNIVLSLLMIIGALTVLISSLLALIQNNIKKIIAYSTISQLGYMISALGSSNYILSIFHLINHAFFKSLLFLCAGSIIYNLNHKQDIRYMNNLKKYMPYTCILFLISLLCLIGFPFFSGFYSKDSIINAIYNSKLYGSKFSYYILLFSIFFTSCYSFRMYFIIFYKSIYYKKKYIINKFYIKELNLLFIIPLIILSFISIILGYFLISNYFFYIFFKNIFFINKNHLIFNKFINPINLTYNSFTKIPFFLEILGIIITYYIYKKNFFLLKKKKKKYLIILLKKEFYINYINKYYLTKYFFIINKKIFNIIDKKIINKYLILNIIYIIKKISKISYLWENKYLYNYILYIIIFILFIFIYL